MSRPDLFTVLVDQIADAISDRIRPELVAAVEARKLPTLAVTVTEAAAALSVSIDTIYMLIDTGALTMLADVGRAKRVTVASLHTYAGHPLLPKLREAS